MALELEDPRKDIKARAWACTVARVRARVTHSEGVWTDTAAPLLCAQMYLNTGGGQQYSVMAVIDMMNQVKCDVQTVALGNVASTAVRLRVVARAQPRLTPTCPLQTLILANGTKGKRYAMKNSRIMVNQPLGGVQGSFVDVRLQAAEQSRNIKVAREILHLASGKSRDDVGELLDREFFMCACPSPVCFLCAP